MKHEFNVGDLVRVKRGPSSWSLAIVMKLREYGSYWVRLIPDEPATIGDKTTTGGWYGYPDFQVFPIKPSIDGGHKKIKLFS